MHQDPLTRLIRAALREDVGPADLTTELTVNPDARCHGRLFAKQDGVLSGMRPFRRVFDELHAELDDWRGIDDGDVLTAGQNAVTFTGHARAVLTGERTALNFVQRLSGIATMARAFVRAVEGRNVQILDTRKTTPGLRTLEKEAVVHGGARNHRHALFDGVLIKDNHIVASGGVAAAINKARAGVHHLMKIEVEVKSLDELDEALSAHADVILLDNMEIATMREAVERGKGQGVLFEASGGVRLDSVRAIAETGVHFISVGALTHSAPALDLSLEIEL